MTASTAKRELTKCIVASLIAVASMVSAVNAAGARKNDGGHPLPDLTQGGKPDENHDWTLGPTGARGWVHGSMGQTAAARQILVTAVAKGSPADGVLLKGDVILGAGDQPFGSDARIQVARAITAAEQEKGAGVLRLIRWRAGKTDKVELKLAVLGTYSDTAPYDCLKSKKIFDLGCQALAKEGLGRVSIPSDLNALALLASGRKEYLPQLAQHAKEVSVFKADSMAS